MNNTNEQPKPLEEQPAIIDHVPGMPVEVMPVEEQSPQRIREYGGYTNIRSHQPGTRYESGMPIRIDAPVNPQAGDPRVPKLD